MRPKTSAGTPRALLLALLLLLPLAGCGGCGDKGEEAPGSAGADSTASAPEFIGSTLWLPVNSAIYS